MKRRYSGQNVYDALQERLHFIFEEFDNIYLSFSGGGQIAFFVFNTRNISRDRILTGYIIKKWTSMI